MEKKTVIRFLKERRRGSYTLLAKMYAGEIASMSIKMALELIREDLEMESKESVDLHYFSLARAISRFKKKAGEQPEKGTSRKWKFKDASEIKEGQLGPGKFKLG